MNGKLSRRVQNERKLAPENFEHLRGQKAFERKARRARIFKFSSPVAPEIYSRRIPAANHYPNSLAGLWLISPREQGRECPLATRLFGNTQNIPQRILSCLNRVIGHHNHLIDTFLTYREHLL